MRAHRCCLVGWMALLLLSQTVLAKTPPKSASPPSQTGTTSIRTTAAPSTSGAAPVRTSAAPIRTTAAPIRTSSPPNYNTSTPNPAGSMPDRTGAPMHMGSPMHSGTSMPVPQYEEHGPGPDYGPDLGGGCCQDGCCDQCQQSCRGHDFCLAAGFAFVFVQPHFENDIAYTTTTDDGRFTQVADTSFNYDLGLAPRVWLEICKPTQLGFRVTYWQFDQAAPARGAEVNNTGFDTIAAPINVAGINIAATQPGDTFAAGAGLDIDVLDFEGTKWTDFCTWQFGTTAGLRYASIRQTYEAAVIDANDALVNFLQASHRFDGIGPTFSLEARRPMGCLTWFSMARGSLLYGDGEAGLSAFEDITPAAIGRTTFTRLNRNDLLTIGELQFGAEWCKTYCNGKRVFCRAALEGQVWQGAGSATQEDGDLGLFGFHAALGMTL